jgi:hypothetical protein
VSIRPVFAVLIALAMLVAPFAMQGASARAAMPADHHAQMIEAAHCAGEEGKAGKSVDLDCCAAMCATASLAPAVAADLPTVARGDDQPATDQFGRSHLAKLPTPPPRIA